MARARSHRRQDVAVSLPAELMRQATEAAWASGHTLERWIETLIERGVERTGPLGRPISDLHPSSRLRNVLDRLGALTIGDVTRLSAAEITAQKNIGEATVRELREALARLGLSLRE